METNNEIAVVGLVPRAVALALAVFTTGIISVSVATLFSVDGAEFIVRAAVAPVRAIIGV